MPLQYQDIQPGRGSCKLRTQDACSVLQVTCFQQSSRIEAAVAFARVQWLANMLTASDSPMHARVRQDFRRRLSGLEELYRGWCAPLRKARVFYIYLTVPVPHFQLRSSSLAAERSSPATRLQRRRPRSFHPLRRDPLGQEHPSLDLGSRVFRALTGGLCCCNNDWEKVIRDDGNPGV